jgi:hypothetical protein
MEQFNLRLSLSSPCAFLQLSCFVSEKRHIARIHLPDNNCAIAKFTMKAMLIPVGLNELLCCSAFVRRAERLSLLCGNVIADWKRHVFS